MDLRFAICDLRLEEQPGHLRADWTQRDKMGQNETLFVSFSQDCVRRITQSHLKRPASGAVKRRGNKTTWVCSPAARGFTFTEILFAVMILGIGFIMVAAMFPVAIQQTQSTSEETIAASIAREGAAYVARIATDATMPPTFQTGGQYFPAPQPTSLAQLSLTWVQPGEVWSFRDRRMYRRSAVLPSSPTVQLQCAVSWAAINHNLILPSDSRYAWFPMYRRDWVWQMRAGANGVFAWTPVQAPYAQVIVIGVQVRNRSTYDNNIDIQPNPQQNMPAGSFEPEFATADIMPEDPAAGRPSLIHFLSGAGGRAVPGAHVVISYDNQRENGVPVPGSGDPRMPPIFQHQSLNGTVFRIGNDLQQTKGQGWFELAPGQGLQKNVAAGNQLNRAQVLLIGRGYADPTKPAQGFSGPAQDIAVYTTIVQVN